MPKHTFSVKQKNLLRMVASFFVFYNFYSYFCKDFLGIMATLEKAVAQVQELLRTVGRAGLHRLYPSEFEMYAMAFEVVNSKFETEAYLLFPVMPDSVTKSEANPIVVEKTMAGVHSTVNPTFVPYDTTVIGTFGVKLRFVTTEKSPDGFVSFGKITKKFFKQFVSNAKNVLQGKELTFSNIFKTGYGTCKLLEYMFDLGAKLDKYGKPYLMIMYDLSFNDIHIVEPLVFNFSQDAVSNNMMWRYNLSVKHVAPLSSINSAKKKTVRKTIKGAIINKTIQTFAKSLQRYTVVDLS